MKVVLFCGGLGMRLREYSDQIPKPMVTIGYRPIIWHVMKYYAHYRHKDFILCLGHKADFIKKYFLNYDECLSNDFVLTEGGNKLDLLSSDIHDWRITFADTGTTTNIGGRLMRVKPYLEGEDIFLANYTDNLSDVDLEDMLEKFKKTDAVAAFVGVKPNYTFHIIHSDTSGHVTDIQRVHGSSIRCNGGYFILRKEIFDYMNEGEELVEQPFERLIKERKLFTYQYDGFWACMDTFKEKQQFDDMFAQGNTPWEVWNRDEEASRAPAEGAR